MIEAEGLEQVYERHALLGRATREAARALDLELLGGVADDNANVVTAIALPDAIDGGKVPKLMRDRFGVTIAGGQGKLKGRIARIAHCGYFGAFDIIVTVSALEMTLRELGHEAEPGAGVARRPARLLRRGRRAPRVKVLVREKIGDSGVQLLRDAGLEVELGIDWDQDELERRIGEFDGILIRSATQLDADAARARRAAEGRRPRRAWGWTTWTWTPPPSAA